MTTLSNLAGGPKTRRTLSLLTQIAGLSWCVVACSSESTFGNRTITDGTGGPAGTAGAAGTGGTAGSGNGGSAAAGNAASGGASGNAGSSPAGGTQGIQCTDSSQCPQRGCFMCPATVCVNGQCVLQGPIGGGGALGSGGRGSGGNSTGGAGAGGASGGSGGQGTGGSGPAVCPDHVPRLAQYPFTPEKCTFADGSLSCRYSTPENGPGCTTTFACRCLSNHMGGADCNWLGSTFACPDGGP